MERKVEPQQGDRAVGAIDECKANRVAGAWWTHKVLQDTKGSNWISPSETAPARPHQFGAVKQNDSLLAVRRRAPEDSPWHCFAENNKTNVTNSFWVVLKNKLFLEIIQMRISNRVIYVTVLSTSHNAIYCHLLAIPMDVCLETSLRQSCYLASDMRHYYCWQVNKKTFL